MKTWINIIAVAVAFSAAALDAQAGCVSNQLDSPYVGCIQSSYYSGSGSCSGSGGACSGTLYNPPMEVDQYLTLYYGYRDGVNKSGAGRSNAALAKLDVCFNAGSNTVDYMANIEDCYTYCDVSYLNVACQGTSSAGGCYERCDDVNSYDSWPGAQL